MNRTHQAHCAECEALILQAMEAYDNVSAKCGAIISDQTKEIETLKDRIKYLEERYLMVEFEGVKKDL